MHTNANAINWSFYLLKLLVSSMTMRIILCEQRLGAEYEAPCLALEQQEENTLTPADPNF